MATQAELREIEIQELSRVARLYSSPRMTMTKFALSRRRICRIS